MKKLVQIAGVVLSIGISIFAQRVTADLVITNANIHTLDTERPTARSIAMLNGRIIAVGSDADTKGLVGSATRVIDAKGRLVMPGFNDAHVHFTSGGMQ